MKKNGKRILCFSVAVLSALILAAPSGLHAAPQQTPTEPQVLTNAVANQPIHFDVSPSLSELASKARSPQTGRSTHRPRQPKMEKFNAAGQQGIPRVSGVRPTSSDPLISATLGLGFEGVGNTSDLSCPNVDAGLAFVPPDTNAAVGDTLVVE
jgi:hypothetical protein